MIAPRWFPVVLLLLVGLSVPARMLTVRLSATPLPAAPARSEIRKSVATPAVDLSKPRALVMRGSLVDAALAEEGTPYVWGGTTDAGYDCSGFIQSVYSEHGVEMPRLADEQFYATVPVPEPEPGDLVFFETYLPGPSHVGIYLGGGKFVHASSGAGEVTTTELAGAYYTERFLGARRPVEWAWQ